VHIGPGPLVPVSHPSGERLGSGDRLRSSNEAAVLRLAGAVLLEVHDEWAIAERRYLSEGSMARLDPGRDDELTKEVDRAKTVLLAS
jgi:hypothetical protein